MFHFDELQDFFSPHCQATVKPMQTPGIDTIPKHKIHLCCALEIQFQKCLILTVDEKEFVLGISLGLLTVAILRVNQSCIFY